MRQYWLKNETLFLKYDVLVQMPGANDGNLKCICHTTTLPKFWMKVLPEYPDLAINSYSKNFPVFKTSYLSESGFSVIAATKTKQAGREGHIAGVIEFRNS